MEPEERSAEKVREMMGEKLDASVLPEPLWAELKEVVMGYAQAFLTKGDPIQPLVDYYHTI